MTWQDLILNIAVIAAVLFAAAYLRLLKRTIVAWLAVMYAFLFYDVLTCGSECSGAFFWPLFWVAFFTLPFAFLAAPIGSIAGFILMAMVAVAGWTLIEWLVKRRRRHDGNGTVTVRRAEVEEQR